MKGSLRNSPIVDRYKTEGLSQITVDSGNMNVRYKTN